MLGRIGKVEIGKFLQGLFSLDLTRDVPVPDMISHFETLLEGIVSQPKCYGT